MSQLVLGKIEFDRRTVVVKQRMSEDMRRSTIAIIRAFARECPAEFRKLAEGILHAKANQG